MTQPVDRKVSVSPPPANAAALVGETLAFLVAWRRILSGTGPWPTAEVGKLREQSRALQARARDLGVGGLAHHLQTCDDCLAFEVVDRAELSRRLRNVSELTSQLRQETDPIRSSRPPAPGGSSRPAAFAPAPARESALRSEKKVAPPEPVVLDAPASAAAAIPAVAPKLVEAEPSIEAAVATHSPPPADAVAPATELAAPGPAESTASAPRAAEASRPQSSPPRPPSVGAPPSDAKREPTRSDAPRFQIPRPQGSISSLRPRALGGAPATAPRPAPSASARPSAPLPASSRAPQQSEATPRAPETVASKPPQTVASRPPEVATPKAPETKPLTSESATPKAPEAAAAASKAPASATGSTLLGVPTAVTATVEIGAAAPDAAPRSSEPAGPLASPAIPIERAPATPLVQQAPDNDASARAKLDTLVGLSEAEDADSDSQPSRPPVYVPPTAPPPPRRDVRPPELSVLARGGSEPTGSLLARDVALPSDRTSLPGLPPTPPLLVTPPLESVPPPSAELDEVPWQTSWSRPATRWWLLPVLAGALAIVGVFWQEIRGYTASLRGTPAPQPPAPESPKEIAPEPPLELLDVGERLRALVERVHAYGGKESPELTDLINREAEIVGRALGQPCAGPAACAAAARARALLAPRALATPKQEAEGARALGAWLVGLSLPGIGVRDVPVVQERVEFHTRYTTGREALQVLLFQCAPYRQTIVDSLLQHELPLDLMALPMAESGCLPDVETRAGARGLWQLPPEAAAAYHLEVFPEVLDERLSTSKATEAALRFLSDVHAKLGSWELALASYHAGPFELIALLLRAEPEKDFWRLTARGQFSEQASAHVGRVQAFAVILANLQHFGFVSPEDSEEAGAAELEVPAGTRLGIVARAAGSSLTRLRELNPELLADTLPDVPGKAFRLLVPGESARRARQRLPGLIAASDAADRCVPYSFDWGRQRFTKAMASRCEYLSAADVP